MRRHVSIVLMTVLLTFGLSVPVGADHFEEHDSPGVIACTAAGVVNVNNTSSGTVWLINGVGSCTGDNGPWLLDFTTVGTSSNLGLCSADNPEPVVLDLNLTASLTLTDILTLVPRTKIQRWFAPVTTYPITTPFLIEGNGELGAGTIFTRIFAQCPNAGSPVAQFDLAFFDD